MCMVCLYELCVPQGHSQISTRISQDTPAVGRFLKCLRGAPNTSTESSLTPTCGSCPGPSESEAGCCRSSGDCTLRETLHCPRA